MHTVHEIPYHSYYVRSPGGRVVDSFRVNMTIAASQDHAKSLADALASRLNNPGQSAT